MSIESGSGDREGLDKIAELIAGRLQALGGKVELIEPDPADIYRMVDTPKQIGKMVLARFTGTGTKKILLIAHMDTVYLRGMLAKQPFRVDGNRAYGLGIADDKQGIAVILHTLAMLKAMNFRDYGLVTVLINADEEVSSAGSRSMLTKTRRRARCRVLVRRLARRFRPAVADDRRHRGGRAQRAGQGIARRLGAGARRQRALRACASDPADARSVRSRDRTQDELDGRQRRHQSQRHSGDRVGDGRRARAARRRLRRHRAEGEGAHQETADPRHQGRDDVRAPPAAARIDAGQPGAREARAAHLRRDRQGTSSSATLPKAAAPTRRSPRSRPRRPSSSASGCAASARIRTTPNTSTSIRSSRACTCWRE